MEVESDRYDYGLLNFQKFLHHPTRPTYLSGSEELVGSKRYPFGFAEGTMILKRLLLVSIFCGLEAGIFIFSFTQLLHLLETEDLIVLKAA